MRNNKGGVRKSLPPPETYPDHKKIDELHDQELLDFVRETVVKLNILADRLESYAQENIRGRGAGPYA